MQTTHSIYSTYTDSPVGNIRISCNNDCITEVHFLPKEETKQANVAVQDAPPVLQQCLDELTAYFKGQRKHFSVPLQQDGTHFQQMVWNELLNIPFGKTISYLTLAKRLGDPKVIRAAAATNGKNNIAIIVPCHRVIGSNNDLIGYGGGIWRKRWLLEMETKIAYGVQTLF